ncbi:hypothetical protein K0M31_019545, partial [Melipona bicolor]
MSIDNCTNEIIRYVLSTTRFNSTRLALKLLHAKQHKPVVVGVREQSAKPPSALKDSFCPVMKQTVDRKALDRGARMFSRTENPEAGVYVMSHQCREYP